MRNMWGMGNPTPTMSTMPTGLRTGALEGQG